MSHEKVINPTFIIASIRAGVVRSGLPISRDDMDRVIRNIVKEVLASAVPYMPPEIVTAEQHRLLEMKYDTAVGLLELYTKQDCE